MADEHGEQQVHKRRGILAAAAATLAGIIAKQASEPVIAANVPIVVSDVAGSGIQNNLVSPLLIAENGGFGSAHVVSVSSVTSNVDGLFGNAQVGSGGKGVHGQTNSGYGVYGEALGSNGYGVTGVAIDAYGVKGTSTSGTGVFGLSTSSVGVRGVSSSDAGVRGDSAGGAGVLGVSSGNYGVLGVSTAVGYAGLTGITTTAGVPAFAGGTATAGALAAQFGGGVYIDCTTPAGGHFVVNPMSAKSGLVMHPDGSHRLMYSMEAPESWAVDIGEGTLINGLAHVALDLDFAAVVETNRYLVFLTAGGETKGLYYTNKTARGFEVREQQGGMSSVAFTWKVLARPRNQKSARMAKYVAPAPLPLAAPKSPEPAALPKKP